MPRAFQGIAFLLMLCGPVRTAMAAANPDPPSPRELLAEAKRAADRNEPAAAQKLAEQVIAQAGDPALTEEARLMLVDALVAQGHHLPAYEQCEKFLDAHPRSAQRSNVLRREFDIAQALAEPRGSATAISASRLQDAVRVFEKVIEHAPFGPLADQAIFAMAEAHRQRRDYEEARDGYERLLKNYPHSSLSRRAIVGRTACNYRLSQSSPNDTKAAEDASRDLDLLAKSPGEAADLVEQRHALRDTIARGDYEAGLFYFRSDNVTAGLRYIEAVLVKYPDSTYAARARRIFEEGIIAKFPETDYAKRAQQALAASTPRAEERKEKP
jgi:outer membrane assembly lipoprotein YfiO